MLEQIRDADQRHQGRASKFSLSPPTVHLATSFFYYFWKKKKFLVWKTLSSPSRAASPSPCSSLFFPIPSHKSLLLSLSLLSSTLSPHGRPASGDHEGEPPTSPTTSYIGQNPQISVTTLAPKCIYHPKGFTFHSLVLVLNPEISCDALATTGHQKAYLEKMEIGRRRWEEDKFIFAEGIFWLLVLLRQSESERERERDGVRAVVLVLPF